MRWLGSQLLKPILVSSHSLGQSFLGFQEWISEQADQLLLLKSQRQLEVILRLRLHLIVLLPNQTCNLLYIIFGVVLMIAARLIPKLRKMET